MPKRVKATQQSESGRNERFHDNFKNIDMTRSEFVERIEKGEYDKYHVRNINGKKTPVSNPDKTRNNNLG